METIFAQATVMGRAGVAVVRVSGPAAFQIGASLAGSVPGHRQSGVRYLRDDAGEVLDQALVLAFEGPHSFTGEDVVEFHLHGSIAVIRAVLGRLSEFENCRLADPGEFSRRAMENGRMDLAQIEGLGDLIEAETEAQRKQAMRGLTGKLAQRVEEWRSDLIRAASLLTVTIDFADEDVPVDVSDEVAELLQTVLEGVENELEGVNAAERIRSGFEVAIVGPANAGKSTLLNALAGRDAAITSEVAGTTRDVIEVRMDIGGLPVTFLDTAGLRETADSVERIGVQRALERSLAADLRIFLNEEGEELIVAPFPEDIVLRPKADLRSDKTDAISGHTGEGVAQLISRIQRILETRVQGAGLATQERHRVALVHARESLISAITMAFSGSSHYDFAAEELRLVIHALEGLIGRVDVENFLDEIFANFCIGK
ncbi:tRNA uridine-5-carboxymethylaminomethyl(34) synthesis GTPase MnmE [Sulfitobacter alexandrii]|uniref:tRNA modification GTPase MnmE n=1 Tax=Sulfitobacter alexandrii TaxID=1917485 RepID=A0A1J0WLP6_9RHOB|nr:tRNA uridine-5-carboxymethylaminomethyl(34) synthesis GTPase MnmE [Sulfitobacter alexandrii]APE45094.1 tRNA uridine-5-carboxymethylaminomethyl(34) synthesis GTPase MnmE [Sulfitobacter alexandrii]